MKVIGKTEHELIVTATVDEIAQVMGYGGDYYVPENHKPKVGATVQVSQLWTALEYCRKMKRAIASIAGQMRDEAERVETISKILANPVVEVQVKS